MLSATQAGALALLDEAYEAERRAVLPTTVPLALYLAWDAMVWSFWDIGCQAAMGKAL